MGKLVEESTHVYVWTTRCLNKHCCHSTTIRVYAAVTANLLALLALQVSGEAQYTDDVALPPNTLHAAFVTSTKPHAKLLGVDASAALAMPGESEALLYS